MKHTPNDKNETKNEQEATVFGCGMEEVTLAVSSFKQQPKQWSFGHVVGEGRHEGTSAKRDGGAFLRLEERTECADGRREAERGGTPSYEWALLGWAQMTKKVCPP